MSGEQKEVFIVFFDFYSIVDSVHFDENRAIERAKEGGGDGVWVERWVEGEHPGKKVWPEKERG